ncbi:hypothetical protein WK62_36555 [Burkholderia ubonensis]|nr:hypothetical protein WK62_36555 [Burkholderia ubonensis]
MSESAFEELLERYRKEASYEQIEQCRVAATQILNAPSVVADAGREQTNIRIGIEKVQRLCKSVRLQIDVWIQDEMVSASRLFDRQIMTTRVTNVAVSCNHIVGNVASLQNFRQARQIRQATVVNETYIDAEIWTGRAQAIDSAREADDCSRE